MFLLLGISDDFSVSWRPYFKNLFERWNQGKDSSGFFGIFTHLEIPKAHFNFLKMIEYVCVFFYGEQKIGPSWLLHTLAGLYWRGHGRTSNSIECFRQALSSVPAQQLHIPLTNLAALLLKMGHTEDALALAKTAHQMDHSDANIHFLMGLLHLASSNYSASVAHFQRSSAANVADSDVETYRLIASCRLKEMETAQQLQCRGVNFNRLVETR